MPVFPNVSVQVFYGFFSSSLWCNCVSGVFFLLFFYGVNFSSFDGFGVCVISFFFCSSIWRSSHFISYCVIYCMMHACLCLVLFNVAGCYLNLMFFRVSCCYMCSKQWCNFWMFLFVYLFLLSISLCFCLFVCVYESLFGIRSRSLRLNIYISLHMYLHHFFMCTYNMQY